MITVFHVVLFDLIIYILILSSGYRCLQIGKINADKSRFIFILFILFCLYPAWGGDYFHYRETFQNIKEGYDTHLEDIYRNVIQKITPTYFLFRLLVWGCATFLLYKTCRYADTDNVFSFLVFALLFLPFFSYARVSLAMALIYFGVSLIVIKKQKLKIILGFLILVSSFYFHKSALFGIGIVLLAMLLSERIGKKMTLVVMASFPLLIMVTTKFLSDSLTLDASDFELINIRSAQNYLTTETAMRGLVSKIIFFLMQATYYLILIEYILVQFSGKYKLLPRLTKTFATASFLTIIVASIFAFDLGFSTNTMYYRFLYFAMIPSAVFIAHCIKTQMFVRYTKVVIIVGITHVLISLLYSCYLAQLPNYSYTW